MCRRRVFPRSATSTDTGRKAAEEHETFLVQFALDDPPLIPDLRTGRLSLAEGKYPLAHGTCSAGSFSYEVDYFCFGAGRRPIGLLGLRDRDQPGETSRHGACAGRVDFRRECDLFKDHYIPFAWDRRHWLPGATTSLEGTDILHNSKRVGRIQAGPWKAVWEQTADFPKELFDAKYGKQNDAFAAPHLRLEKVAGAIHFFAELGPGEKKAFALALLTNFEGATSGHRQALLGTEPAQGRTTALKHFQSQITPEHARLTFPQENWDKIFTALQLSTLQLLVRFPGENSLMPTQGGSNERHFVWVWEAMCMLLPMLRIGHFQPVRRALDFIFSLQDAGCPPSGKLTTTAGAVGTMGPKWLNTTGAALALAAEYERYARDGSFLPEYLPKIIKAVQWIVGEIPGNAEAQRRRVAPALFRANALRLRHRRRCRLHCPLYRRLHLLGIGEAVLLLEQLTHPKAAEFRKELETYRGDLDRAVQALTRPDGYIERKILSGPKPVIYEGFESICGMAHLAFAGGLDIRSERFRRYVDYVEAQMMDGYFTGRVSPNVYYMGVGEFVWHHAYLRLGQWKKAFAAMRINLRYGMTRDALQVQERFDRRDPAFTPWQPNGSGNGRVLEMMLNCLYFEHDGLVTLLGGVPWAWLRGNKVTRLEGLHTPQGRFDLEATMLDAQHCRLTLRAAAPGVLPARLCLPEYFELCTADPTPAPRTKQYLELARHPRTTTLLLRKVVF